MKMHEEKTGENMCAIYVDMGTTNTRGWLMCGSEVIARASKPVGVRDTARDGSKKRIHDALREMIEALRAQVKTTSKTTLKTASKTAVTKLSAPACVAATGMISSPLGLAEVPHVGAPAGLAEIAAASKWFQFPEVTDLPVLLVPGVRSGPARALFSVRLLGLAGQGTPEDRLSFLIGAFIASDMDALISRGVLSHDTPVVIIGSSALAEAWRSALATRSVSATLLSVPETEDALLTGLRCTLEKCLTTKNKKEHKVKLHRRGAETRKKLRPSLR